MKKVLIIAMLLSTTMFAGKLELRMSKDVNGGRKWSLPYVEHEFNINNFVFKPSIDLKYSAIRSSSTPNHYSVDTEFQFGYRFKSFYITKSIGIEKIFEGNSEGHEAGSFMYNTLRIGFEF